VGICVRSGLPRTDVLGNLQSSLRDWFWWERIPSTACWAIFSRPCGTGTDTTLMAGLSSASAVQMSRSKKLIWTSLTFSRPFGTDPGTPVWPVFFHQVLSKSTDPKKANLDRSEKAPPIPLGWLGSNWNGTSFVSGHGF
jgi:hypothetical protein